MPRATLGTLTTRLTLPDLRLNGGDDLTPSQVRTDVLSGLTVALALVPEAVPFGQ